MGNSVLIKLQAEDNLTPKLQANMDKLGELYGKVKELETALKTLRNQKGGIVSGDIKSDIENVAKLQAELKALQKDGNSAQIKKKEAEINRAVNQEIINLTNSLREQRDERARLSIITEKSYAQFKKDEQAKKKDTKATQDNTGAIQSNNAVRNSSINSLVRHIRQVETLVVSVYGLKRAYDTLLGSGISLHRQIESQTAGIAALITANTRLASGSKDLAKHFKIASQTAEQTMKKIKTASVETAATFPELTAIFQQAVGGALGAGKAMGDTIEKQIDNTITLSKRMSNIASAIGMPMQQVNEEIRSIIEGTIDINSRIAKMIGITNEEIRKAKTEQDGLVKYLNEKLKPFDALADIQSFDRMIARIKDKIDNIKLDATEEAFKQIKLHLKDLDDWLAKNREEVVKVIADTISNIATAIKNVVFFVKEWHEQMLLLAQAFVIFKAGGWVVGGIGSINKSMDEAAKTMGVVSAGATGATKALNLLKTTLFALRGAFAGLAIYGVISLMANLRGKAKENKIDFEALNKVLAKTNEELEKMSNPELARDKKTLVDSRKKIEDRIYATMRSIENMEREYGSDEIIKFQKEVLAGLEKKLKEINDQLQNVNEKKLEAIKTENKYNQAIKNQKEYLEALSKLSPEVQKLVEKYGKDVFNDDDEKKLKELVDAIKKAKEDLKKVIDNPQLIQELNNTIENLTIKKNGLEKKMAEDDKREAEERTRAAKQAHEEAMRRAKEKADWQIKHAKSVGDTEKAFRLELQQYEKELQEIVAKGYITRAQKADLLRQKEKEHHEKRLKEQKELDEAINKEYEEKRNAEREFYEAIGEYQKAAEIAIQQEFNKLYEYAKKAGIDINNEVFKKIEAAAKKAGDKFNKEAKKSFKDIKNSWADTVSSMSKTVDDGFFNYFIGKTKSLKKALKDMGTNLMRDFISPYARTLSQGISGGFGAMLGGGSNLAQIATDLGLSKADNGGWVGTIGNTAVELSSRGEIVKGAGAIDQSTQKLLGSISNLKTAYDTFTGSIGSGFANFGNYLSGMGYTGSGQFMSGVGGGISNLFGGNAALAGATSRGTASATMALNSASPYYTAGAGLGGGLVGGAAGYGIGAGLDKAFGAQTYAPQTGMAAGAAVGTYAGLYGIAAVPVWGWIAAAVLVAIGGMIGKSKITDWGYQVGQDLSLGLDKGLDGGVNNWKEKTKKSWFSKSVSNQTSPIDEQTQKMLNQYVRTSSVLLKEFTGGDFNLPARTYNKRTLIDEGFGGALIAGVMGKNYDKALSFGGNEGELEKTYRYWMEQAKQDKKETYDLLAEYVGKINSNIKNLKLESLNNSLEKMKFANDEALDALKTLNSGLGAFSNDIDRVSRDTAGQIEKAYREALKNDFSKETVQRYEALTEAYKKAKQAQDDYLKAILNFTQQIASSQASFYQAHGIDSSFMNYQSLYTRFRAIVGSLERDISDKDLQGVLKNGNTGNINSWAKHFLGLSSNDLGGFLSSGNSELRQELLKILTEYQNLVTQNGGHEYWLKSMSDLEALNKQIEALKLAQKVQTAQEQLKANMQANLDAQKAQLELLKAQKSAVEKLANIVQKIRDNVIDRTTSSINYQAALEQAKKAYASGDYQSKAFDNLSSAADKQSKYFEETSQTYEEYKLNMLKMAGEIEGMAGGKSLEDINRAILEVEDRIKKSTKILEDQFKDLNKTGQDQLAALEAQRQALIDNSKAQLDQMNNLLGNSSPMVRYLKDVLERLIKPEIGEDGKPRTPSIPNYTTPGNINTGVNTANGAVVKTELDKFINNTYLSVLGRSVEQSGLDYWRSRIQRGDTTAQGLGAELAKMAQALTGSNDKQAWIEWAKNKGYKPFAQGGIVTRPTRALIGEAGYPEAVIPLKGGNGVKVDMDGGFRSLERVVEGLVMVVRGIAKDVKEMAMTDRNTTNGDERYVRLVGIPTVRIEK